MHRLFITLIAAASFLAGEQPPRIAVLTYNIHHGEGVDGKIDLERIAAVIGSVSPDLVALQEVDRKTKRSGGVDQAAELARRARMQLVYGRTIDFQGGLYGNAVLSRLPVHGYKNIPLPHSKDREPRAVLVVEVSTAGGAPFRFLATHLDISEHDRLQAVPELLRIADGPALLAGDLNAVPGSEVMRRLTAIWEIAGDRELPTSPAASPRRQIDYVLFHPAERWRVIETRVLDEPVASDHRPLLAILEFLQPR